MGRIRNTCQRTWRRLRNVVVNGKQAICNMAKTVTQKVRDLFWDYPTYAEYVERWTKEIDTYCTKNNLFIRDDNFEIIKKDVAKAKKSKLAGISYIIGLIATSVTRFLSFVLPFVVLFFITPLGGEEGIVQIIWDSMQQNEALKSVYIQSAFMISIFILWCFLTVENAKNAFKDNQAKTMKESTLNDLGLALFNEVKGNNFKFK